MKSWATDDLPHLFISGNTGAGKTILMKQIVCQNMQRAGVVVDPLNNFNRFPVASNPQQVKQHFVNGADKVTYRPHWNNEQAKEHLHEIVGFLFSLSKNARSKQFILAVDEVHNYARNGDNQSPIVRAYKEGRNLSVKCVSTSQYPARVQQDILMQGVTLWGGSVSEYGRPYLEGYNFPMDEIKQNGKHDFLLFDENHQVVERVRASSRYVD